MFSRRRKYKDFADEIEAHIAIEADRLRGEGMSEADAQTAARKRFGNRSATRERFYDKNHVEPWDQFRRDLLYALRSLRRSPGFPVAAIVTLALGIGANTALFSVVDDVLIRPLPYPDSKRLVMLNERLPDGSHLSLSPADFLDYRRQSNGSKVAAIPRLPSQCRAGSLSAGEPGPQRRQRGGSSTLLAETRPS